MLLKRTLSSQVIDYLLNLMKTGQVGPGEKLPTEKTLTALLGVSRTCVREAFKSLESLDLISVRPKIGAVVKEPSPSAMFRAEHLSPTAHRQHTDLLIEFRKILEVGLASLASAKADGADLAAMQSAIDEHQRAIAMHQPAYQADIDFHLAIADASKNPFAIMVFRSILEPLTHQRMRTNQIPNAAEDGLRDHRKILAAIKDRSDDRARSAMLEHMATAEYYWNLAKAQAENEALLRAGDAPLPREASS